jgi:ubiquinone/menaquinone biosynthesis C-methylase UbiE
MSDSQKPVESQVYSADYFLTECEGHDEFLRTGGKELPRRLTAALELAGDVRGKRVLDLGCGRGEVVRTCLERGARAVGLDFSYDALVLAQRILPSGKLNLIRADVQRLPFQNTSFDLVFALDLVEHLYPAELDRLLAEVYYVLAPGGRLIVHTMPNIWYYRYGYPLFRVLQYLRRVRLPLDPRDRWRYVHHVHVNEQSVMSLRRSLKRASFSARIELRNQQDFGQEPRRWVRQVMTFLATTYPLTLVFCNDLFGVATKNTDT